MLVYWPQQSLDQRVKSYFVLYRPPLALKKKHLKPNRPWNVKSAKIQLPFALMVKDSNSRNNWVLSCEHWNVDFWQIFICAESPLRATKGIQYYFRALIIETRTTKLKRSRFVEVSISTKVDSYLHGHRSLLLDLYVRTLALHAWFIGIQVRPPGYSKRWIALSIG